MERRYRKNTLMLETTLTTFGGVVKVLDFMPPRGSTPRADPDRPGHRGMRFGYGRIVPWVRVSDRRYIQPESGASVDGLPGSEGAFLACSFWLVNALLLIGKEDDATEMFERLLESRSDVALLSEEYDPRLDRQVGNSPQAFSHVPLIQAALNLDSQDIPVRTRRHGEGASSAAALMSGSEDNSIQIVGVSQGYCRWLVLIFRV
jgi:Glycosyl hydrolases family 15